jgi:hypothetical protein
MTALVWWGKCLWMRSGRGSFRGVACSPEAKPAPSGTAGNTVDQYRLKPLHREVGRPIQQLESESQKGNPGSSVSRVGLSRTLLFPRRIAQRADAGRLVKRPSIAYTLAQRPVGGGNLPLRTRVLGNASAPKRRFHDRKCQRNLRRRAYGDHPCRRWRKQPSRAGPYRPASPTLRAYGRESRKPTAPVRARAGPVLRPAGDTRHAGAGQNRYKRFSTASARSSGLNNYNAWLDSGGAIHWHDIVRRGRCSPRFSTPARYSMSPLQALRRPADSRTNRASGRPPRAPRRCSPSHLASLSASRAAAERASRRPLLPARPVADISGYQSRNGGSTQ